MSRHLIPSLNSNHEVYVGWDHPLLTYFGQVYDLSIEEEDERLVYWIGADPGQHIYEIEELAVRMRKYADISNEMRVTLYGDKDEGR
jgi:hypothetical protein